MFLKQLHDLIWTYKYVDEKFIKDRDINVKKVLKCRDDSEICMWFHILLEYKL